MVKDIIPAAFDFIENHILDITLVILAFFGLLIYIVLNNVKFPKSHPTLQKVVVLENLENAKTITKALSKTPVSDKVSEIEDIDEAKARRQLNASQPQTTAQNVNLCSGSAEDNSKYCSSLATKDKCGGGECCVWARKKKTQNFSCVSGNSDGATNINDYDAYYYKNKYTPANPGSPGNIQVVSQMQQAPQQQQPQQQQQQQQAPQQAPQQQETSGAGTESEFEKLKSDFENI
jgi:hypothetical protein